MPELDDNWTERPHWVVMVIDSPGEEHCAGHHPTRKLADAQAQRLPKGNPFPKVRVERSR